MIDTMNKLCKNELIKERLFKINSADKQKMIEVLLKDKTERELAKELDIPRSTINDWRTLRQNNTGEHIHASLSLIYRKISNLEPDKITDWGRITQIRDKCEELLKRKPSEYN